MGQRRKNRVTVYGLKASDDESIRYIGQTGRRLKKRLADHKRDAILNAVRRKNGGSPVQHWIRQTILRGETIEIFPIEEDARRDIAEIQHIDRARRAGWPLLNVTDGGD